MQKLSPARQINMHITIARLMMPVLTVLLVTCIPAAAQSDWQLFGGFSYGRADTSSELEPFGVEKINAFGWGASITNYTSWARWFGATVEASGFYKHPSITIPAGYIEPGVPVTNETISNAIYATAYTVMGGPSFAYRGNPNIEPFVHFLFGGVNGDTSLTGKGEILAGTYTSASDWVFGYGLGGGVDFKISKRLAVRGQADWIQSTFRDADIDRQSHIRVLGGLVLRLAE
jgi:opacity protein-like surface antigen